MNWKNWLVSIASAGLLAACGGGGSDAGDSPFVDDDGAGSSVAASLLIALDKTSVLNTDTAGVTATVTAVDAKGKTLPDIAISYSVSGGVYTQPTNVTDESGDNEAVIKLGSNKANRTITIRATDGKNTATAYLTVTGAKLNSQATPAVIAPGASGSVIFRLLNATSDAMVGQSIEVVTSAGATATGVTNSSGEYTYTYTAPSSTGTMTVTATAAGVTTTQDVLVQSSGSSIPDAGPDASVIAEKSMDINPTVVSVNSAGSTSNAATVRVLFRGASNNALPNVRVKFGLANDINSVGGTFSVNEVYTDANGYATTSYIPGTKPSPTNGVTIRACYAVSGLPADVTCSGSNEVSSTLTVTSEAVSVTVGADENVYVDQQLVYYRRYVVQVVDAAGRVMPGVTITPQVDLLNYAKGYFDADTNYETRFDYQCVNEDLNRNATLDSAEDVNHDLVLSPRKADVAVSIETTGTGGKTDANGRIILRVTYPRSHASWVKYALNVAGSVDGSEGRASWIEWAPYPANALSGTGAPAFVASPYGVVTTNVTLASDTTMPDGTVVPALTVLTPCQNPTPPNEILP